MQQRHRGWLRSGHRRQRSLNCGGCGIECTESQICNVDTCEDVDPAPGVASSTATAIAATDGTFEITFSEAVDWDGSGTFDCPGDEPASHNVTTGDNLTFTVTLTGTLMYSATCTFTIASTAVTDQDTDDAVNDHMTADEEVLFTLEALNEDFEDLTPEDGTNRFLLPAGWTLQNVDAKTPAGSVSYVNAAWIVREDFKFDVADHTLFSTSWYSPVGAADDWIFTPITKLGTDCSVNWNAVTYDPAFRDGYEVRFCATATAESCVGNPTLFSTGAEETAWTPRTASLSSANGQEGYIAFRNPSNDMFLLLLDDINITCP